MKTPLPFGERAFHALLLLCPREFREAYEVELLELFRHRAGRRRASGGRLGLGFWSFIVRDVVSTAWKEHRDPIRERNVDTTTSGDGMMRGWMEDMGYAARRLWRSPGFSLTALVILILGIGVNTTAFSVVNALLLQPPPFPEVEQLVDLLQDSQDGEPNSTSYPAYEDIARLDGLFASVAAVNNAQNFIEQDGQLSSVLIEYSTSGYMDVLGLSPTRGRWFDAAEDDPDGAPVAVLSHKMWRDRMASDPDVVGSTLRIGGSAVTVVGVGPEEFNGGAGPAVIDMWMSISALRPTGAFASGSLTRRQDHPFFVRARMLPSVTIEQTQAAMDQLSEYLATTYPDVNEDRLIHVVSVADTRIHPSIDAQLLPGAALLMAVVVLVLVIATLNLANLLLVRTTARAREIAVRLAMGAGRARVTRVVLSEALVLALVGGFGGLGVALWGVGLLEGASLGAGLPVALDVRPDGTVLLFTVGISVLSGLVFGLLPALRVSRRDITASLRDEAGVSIGARRRFGLTGTLVAGQVAVSLVLLAVAGVFIESLLKARSAEPGFDWEGLAFAQVSLFPLELDGDAAAAFYTTLDERLEAAPEIDQATFAYQLPGAYFGSTTMLLGEGLGGVNEPYEIPWNLVGREFFETMGIRRIEGRLFGPQDGQDGAPVVIVTEAFARAHFGRTDVVGETVLRESALDSPQEIIGVVSDVPVRSLGESPTPAVYWPYVSGAGGRANLVVRTQGDPADAAAAVRRVVREADPRILITASMTMEDHLGSTLGQQRLAGMVLGGMGLMALVLAVLGVYGVVSVAVARRKRAVGIRQALGADGSAVIRLFVRDVAAVVTTGAVLGLAAAIPLSRLVGQNFTGASGSPAVVGAVAVLLLSTALAATLVPAAGAARGDPRDVLAGE